MNTAADYIAAAVLIVIAIALFLNVKNGTLGQWLRSKFLGKAPAQGTVFTAPKAA